MPQKSPQHKSELFQGATYLIVIVIIVLRSRIGNNPGQRAHLLILKSQ